ncbi:DUF4468 domain-containing protein [Christiangramia sp. OXR-203]|uniref:DUF4468 domain-containing protein n=1 Tax=Christiangramia sp. OXR-203 TaxID=3100176 RepID=UPI002AC92980|nr:DUF4468 domain-containing protein [Christiangramia sp. OXR-203]WPY97634.1 DUF4468 domain-containing protein [Christiangramia sp. OXR-203]
MKNSILILLFLYPVQFFSQVIDELPTDENGNLYYSEVIQVENADKNELYLRSKQFFAEIFKSANDVIQMDDKDSGIIIGKGFNDIYITVIGIATPIQMWYSIKIQSKDDRYKYDIYDIYFKSYPGQYGVTTTSAEKMFDKEKYYKNNGKPRNVLEKYKIETEAKIKNLESAIKSKMENAAISNDQDKDW